MKIKQQNFSSYLKDILKIPVFLLYGTDTGEVSDIKQKIISTIQKNQDIEIINLNNDIIKNNPSAFWDEVGAISMFSATRIVVYKNPSDTFLQTCDDFLKKEIPNVYLIITSDTFSTKSALVKYLDGEKNALSIGCYQQEGKDVMQTIISTLSSKGYQILPDAAQHMTSLLGIDKGVTLSEIEKLITYMGPDNKKITLQDVENCAINAVSTPMDDLVIAVLAGNSSFFQKKWTLLMQEGISTVAITRSFINRINNLITSIQKVNQRTPIDTILKTTQPFIPYKYKEIWTSIITTWSKKNAFEALSLILDAERDCKTGLPAELICNRALTTLCGAARKIKRL